MSNNPVLCMNGHPFDATKAATCPYCGASAAKEEKTLEMRSDPKTLTYENSLSADDNTYDGSRYQEDPPTRPVWLDEQRIQGAMTSLMIEPVVGWLLSIEGPSRGTDYRIFMGNNSIGRAPEMRIRIIEDEAISRERHAFIIFDPKSNKFVLRPGDSQGLVYLNKMLVAEVKEIKAYDEIELGKSKLLFIPACGERFQWKKS